MKAVIGLGNPGLRYRNTRHNVGFMLLDMIAKEMKLAYRNDFRGKFAEGKLEEEKVLLLKPYTYMNLSGLAVAQLAGFYKVSPQNILVVHDDLDLALGRIRLRAKGSSGGHKGLKSIIAELGSQEFWRLRIGVGRPQEEGDIVNHVLSSFKKDEKEIIKETFSRAGKAVQLWLEGRGEQAMNIYNRETG